MYNNEGLQKEEVCLNDGTSVEGYLHEPLTGWMRDKGVIVSEAHHSCRDGALPLAKTVFVPYISMKYIILEQ